MSNKNFWNLYPLFMKSPPLLVDHTGETIRHAGGSSRCGFWAGYDGITRGPRKGSPGSVVRTAYRAGVAYRKLVDSGKRDPLPESVHSNLSRRNK
jgi:hypothetical protein